MSSIPSLLERVETYYDAAPRAWSRTEEIGPFTLFVARSGWPYYARPRLEWSRRSRQARPPRGATVDDVRAVLSRQRELGVPLALEWVEEITPGLVEVVRSSGASVERCPLLVLDGHPAGDAGTARMLTAADLADLAATQAAIAVSFQQGGTSTGPAGLEERDQWERPGAADVQALAERLTEGILRMAAVYLPHAADPASAGRVDASDTPDPAGAGPVGGGSHIPIGEVTEIVGVGVLPAFRRRGLAGHLTYVLARDAHERGVRTVFCSAQSDDVARVYEAVGFRRVGTACIANGQPDH